MNRNCVGSAGIFGVAEDAVVAGREGVRLIVAGTSCVSAVRWLEGTVTMVVSICGGFGLEQDAIVAARHKIKMNRHGKK